MLTPARLFSALDEAGIRFFTGVPDSLLKDLCAYITDHVDDRQHIIAANEGNAIALAAGHYLGTGHPALVYMQNSGLGNAINPLLSLTDPEVYGLPMLLLIGWRGEPGVADEPQHRKQGRVTPALLDTLGIPWQILEPTTEDAQAIIQTAMQQMHTTGGPAALLVRKGSFHTYQLHTPRPHPYALTREQVIHGIVARLDTDACIVATTGMAARELDAYRVAQGQGQGRDFLTVGSMGHSAAIALGLARSQTQRRIICLDGDGSVLMHMGTLAIVGQSQQENFIHVLLNNGAHDSVGSQPTVGFAVDFCAIAQACGYRHAYCVSSAEAMTQRFAQLLTQPGPSLLEVRLNTGARPDLGRPQSTPADNRNALMHHLGLSRQ
jgi:phosphonopyruvate decarboxylase